MNKTIRGTLPIFLMLMLFGSTRWFNSTGHKNLTAQSRSLMETSMVGYEGGKLELEGRKSSVSTGTCDSGLALDSYDPLDAARAIDICKISTGLSDWGLLSAEWVMADGSSMTTTPSYTVGHGILPGFGSNVGVRQGERLLALSSGTARQPTDPGYQPVVPGFSKGYASSQPAGYPVARPFCGIACIEPGEPHDDAALEVTLRPPTNANGFAFDFKFYATDYPGYVCTEYNDMFLAILQSTGPINGNIAYDSLGFPINVNSPALEVCATDPSTCNLCPYGTSELDGTGFEGGGATVWWTASADLVNDDLIALRFAIYDSGDGAFDSTVLIDNFRWLLEPYQNYLPLIVR
jgi:hypothetical protein